ncbi:MAG: phage portal protein, partial [Firmicutes bacterium]|nr:phage portal protein [Bacillota bacterium]
MRGAPQAKGYSEAGASTSRRALKGFKPDSGSPNEDINYNNQILRQRARMLYMASPVAGAAINTNRTKVVGTGLSLKSSIDRETLGLSAGAAKEWQQHTEREFRLWAGDKGHCDAIGLNNFEGLQQLALTSWLMNGDCFALIKRGRADKM